MFGDISKFLDQDYFQTHSKGILQTQSGTYVLNVFACISTDSYEGTIYHISEDAEERYPKLKEYISNHSYQLTEMPDDARILAFSTCTDATTNGRIVLFADVKKMEAAEQQVIAELDPNGGELAPDQRTWYFREYGGDPVEEYNTATRNYVPSVSGSYFYNYQGYDPAKPTNYGVAQYTEDINSGADLSVAYEYDPGNYAYAQWYEVDPVTGKESIYKFGEPVYHDTKLRLHWKELSTYFVRYDAGEGEIDGNDSNEDAFKNFDSSDYADHANVIISRTANAPDGFNFVGWKVKNDKNETIYYPGQHFEFRSEYATTEYDDNGKPKKYIVMEAVYLPIATATIIYDANGGAIADDADLGKPSAASPILTPVYSNDGTVATVSNLLNNSGVQLSSGNGFVCTSKDGTKSYHFSGWNTEPDGSGTHFDASGQYYVDVYEPMTLYAEWEVNVYFDKANESASWGTAFLMTGPYRLSPTITQRTEYG